MTISPSSGISPLTQKQINSLFAQYKDIEKVVLYGSRAKGNYRLNSDIDLCIEGKAIILTQLLKIEIQLDDLLLPWNIDLSLKHQIDNPALLEHINQYGIIFYSL